MTTPMKNTGGSWPVAILLLTLTTAGCVTDPEAAPVDFGLPDIDGPDEEDQNQTSGDENSTSGPKKPVARIDIVDENNALIWISDFEAGDNVVKGEKGTVRAGTNVTFIGSRSEGRSSDLISYFWDFGDGSRGYGNVTTRVYEPIGGVFKVRLKVTNLDGLQDDQLLRLPVIPYSFPETNETVTGSVRASNPLMPGAPGSETDSVRNGVDYHTVDVVIDPDNIDGELRLQWLNITLLTRSDLDEDDGTQGDQPSRANDFDLYLYNMTNVLVQGGTSDDHGPRQNETNDGVNFTVQERITLNTKLPPGNYKLQVHLFAGAEAGYELWIYRKYKLVNPQVNAILGIEE